MTDQRMTRRAAVVGGVVAVAGAMVFSARSHAETAHTEIAVGGAVASPTTFTVEDLAALPQHEMKISWEDYEDGAEKTFTGPLLWDVLAATSPNIDPGQEDVGAMLYLVVEGYDGYAILMSWGEISPDFGNAEAILAIAENGAPLAEKLQPAWLVVGGDALKGRSVFGVVKITVAEADAADS